MDYEKEIRSYFGSHARLDNDLYCYAVYSQQEYGYLLGAGATKTTAWQNAYLNLLVGERQAALYFKERLNANS
jgi:hypothetical protein